MLPLIIIVLFIVDLLIRNSTSCRCSARTPRSVRLCATTQYIARDLRILLIPGIETNDRIHPEITRIHSALYSVRFGFGVRARMADLP